MQKKRISSHPIVPADVAQLQLVTLPMLSWTMQIQPLGKTSLELDIETLRQGKAFHFCYQIKKNGHFNLTDPGE